MVQMHTYTYKKIYMYITYMYVGAIDFRGTHSRAGKRAKGTRSRCGVHLEVKYAV